MARVLGIDIGGSTTRVRLAVDGQTVAEAHGSSASLTAAGLQRATDVLRAAIAEVLAPGDPAPDAVCAGAAGAGSALVRDTLSELLGQITGSLRVAIVEDMRLILPAAGHAAGVAVICGTGSSAWATDGERHARGGGWGYLLGDEGGGYWLVRAALRTLLSRRDAGEPLGVLGTALVGADGDLDPLLGALYGDPRPELWAARAPAVIGCDDPAVGPLLARGAEQIARTAQAVAERVGLGPGPVVVAGGLVSDDRAAQVTTSAMRAQMPDRPVQLLDAPPVAGAVVLASALAGAPS